MRLYPSIVLGTVFVALIMPSMVLPIPTQDMPHGEGFDLDCALCHVVDSWSELKSPIEFDHNSAQFPLHGRHTQVSCDFCHESLKFKSAPNQCVDCHVDAHNDQFGATCDRCHDSDDWLNYPLFREMHEQTRFPLAGAHGGPDCAACHADGRYVDIPLTCSGCHYDSWRRTDNPDHANAGYSIECDQCHGLAIASFAGNIIAFDHTNVFPLIRGHRVFDCALCHEPGSNYSDTSSECVTCHQAEYDGVDDPDHVAAGFPLDCSICHTIDDWDDAEFDHNDTDFQLTGEHRSLDCNECHLNNVYEGLGDQCFDCHEDDYMDTDDPDHVAEVYPTDCSLCHNTFDWEDAEFDHDLTDFPLTGSHLEVSCADCHSDGYDGIDTACNSCHQDDFDDATDPIHDEQSFGLDCSICHDTVEWEQSSFDHNSDTEYLVLGAHIELNCADCHENGQYIDTPNTCYGCHQADYEGVGDPDHVANNYSLDCLECHTQDNWDVEDNFSHEVITGFALLGAHSALSCDDCHADGFEITDDACASCHQADFDGAIDPIHETATFGVECEICHTADGWSPSIFDHDTQTQFTIDGSHLELNCADCHLDGQYASTPETCYGCHEQEYNDVPDPDHVGSNFSTDCSMCHNTTEWAEVNWDHANTNFPLTGAHLSLDCTMCHADGYTGTPTDCFDCHDDDYNGTIDPDHAANNYPFDCTTCHNTTDWADATFDHSGTNFPLTGAHELLDCNQCHAEGYAGTPTDCLACHETDFNDAVPSHDAESFGTDCEDCHTTDAWTPSTFDHNVQTEYELTGSHLSLDCTLCHLDGQYAGTPTDCFFCHDDDYQQTNDPNHQTAAFPTDCDMCHNTIDWEDADFNHIVWFPIYSGSHQGEWDTCSECHPNPNDYLEFTCLTCHEQGETNADHDEVQDYQYNSLACYDCHPDGEAGPYLIHPDRQQDELSPKEPR